MFSDNEKPRRGSFRRTKPLPPPHQRRKQSIKLYRRKRRIRRRWKHKIRLCLPLSLGS